MPTLEMMEFDQGTVEVPRRNVRPEGSRTLPDIRREPDGNFAGRVGPADPVGTFGNVPRLRRKGAGTFAGDPDRQRQGSFGDHDLGQVA